MTDLIFKGNVKTEEDLKEYKEYLDSITEDPDTMDVFLRIMESAIVCPHDKNDCPHLSLD